MGAFALRRLGDRLLSPTAGVFGAGFLALVVVFPTTGEVRPNGNPLEVSMECSAQPQVRGAIRVAAPCTSKVLAKDTIPKRRLFGGKLGAVLAAALYCRKSVDVSELSGDAAACLPHPAPSQRLIDTNGDAAVEWPGGRLSPALDKSIIQAFTNARLPDG
jgi:hypothetical protein